MGGLRGWVALGWRGVQWTRMGRMRGVEREDSTACFQIWVWISRGREGNGWNVGAGLGAGGGASLVF